MIEYIEIKETKYPVCLNFYAIGKFQFETGQSFNELGSLTDRLYFVEPLLFYSIEQGFVMLKQPITITRDDMPYLLSDNKVFTDFFEIIGKFKPEGNKEDKKK